MKEEPNLDASQSRGGWRVDVNPFVRSLWWWRFAYFVMTLAFALQWFRAQMYMSISAELAESPQDLQRRVQKYLPPWPSAPWWLVRILPHDQK